MRDSTITMPVKACMVKQPDGTFKMEQAEYLTTEAGLVAQWLLAAFGVPAEKKQTGEGTTLDQ